MFRIVAWSVSDKDPFPTLSMFILSCMTFSLSKYREKTMVKKCRCQKVACSLYSTNPVCLGSTLLTSLYVNYPFKALSPNIVLLGIGLQYRNTSTGTIQSIAISVTYAGLRLM